MFKQFFLYLFSIHFVLVMKMSFPTKKKFTNIVDCILINAEEYLACLRYIISLETYVFVFLNELVRPNLLQVLFMILRSFFFLQVNQKNVSE